MTKTAALLTAALLASGGADVAQHAVHTHDETDPVGVPLAESGQSAFAAIAEVIALLDADPETDWTTVGIEALVAHLRDMERVFTDAEVAVSPTEEGADYTITGDGRVAGSIRRMAQAHAATLPPGWRVEVRTNARGAEVSFAVPVAARDRLRALGFLGLLADGAHHRAHHWAIATGGDPH